MLVGDRSPVLLYTFISGLIIDAAFNSTGNFPSLQIKKPRASTLLSTQLWVWTERWQIVNPSVNPKRTSASQRTITLVEQLVCS